MANFKDHYQQNVVPKLVKEFGYANVMQVPKISKITLNMGLGEALENKNVLKSAADDMTRISGQKPIITNARKSVANFKVREGWPVGCKVTLRRERMYEFLERLIKIAIPRVRDFRGLPGKAFDGRGNYSLGLKEQIVFQKLTMTK